MIKTMGELLEKIVSVERELLKDEGVVHGPTVGSMYENFASSLLKEAVFKSDKIRIVSGFIRLSDGKDSPEMDCMIVAGDVTEIRHSNKHRCNIEDVVAVIQVKKNLYARDIGESIDNLASVKNIDCSDCEFDRNFLDQTFQKITGVKINGDAGDLNSELANMYNILATCYAQPVCVALGFEGFLDHDKFRKALVESLESRIAKVDFGIISMPDLVMNQNFAAMKLNGTPFHWPMSDHWWPIYSTTQVAPIVCLLEVLYTKLVQRGLLDNGVFGEDLDQEPSTLLVSAKFDETKNGFCLKTHEFQGVAEAERPVKNWEPVELTLDQYVLISMLCKIQTLAHSDILDMGINEGDIEYLKDSRLIGVAADDDQSFGLITRCCDTVVLPDGRYVAADNESGRLSRWISNYMANR